MLIYYNWNYCDLTVDHLPCIRGSKKECPQEILGVLVYCGHFHSEKKTEDIEKGGVS